MFTSARVLADLLRQLNDRLMRAEDLARAVDVLGNHLVEHAGDPDALDALDGLCGVTNELKLLLTAARDLGDRLQHAMPCGLRPVASVKRV
jgi:hypothetical protein